MTKFSDDLKKIYSNRALAACVRFKDAKLLKLSSIPPRGPLNGILVIEIGQHIAGPQAAEELARDGALVIKLENSNIGDPARRYLSKEIFTSLNAAKASIAIGKNDAELYINTLRLANIIIDNRSNEAKEKDRILQEFLTEKKDEPVIFCSIIGYDGEYKNKRSLDVTIQAESGLAYVNAPSFDKPLKVGTVIIDEATAIYAASAIKSQLIALERNIAMPNIKNNIVKIEVFMAKVAAQLMTGQLLTSLKNNVEPTRKWNRDNFVAPFSFYETKDGFIALAIVDDNQFKRLCEKVLENPKLYIKYPTNKIRLEKIQELEQELLPILITENKDYWLNKCKQNNIACSKVNTVKEAIKEPFNQSCFSKTTDNISIISDVSISSLFRKEALKPAPYLNEDKKQVEALINMVERIKCQNSITKSEIYRKLFSDKSMSKL